MNGNLFVVFTINDDDLGLYAVAEKIPACNNLLCYGRENRYQTMNVCSTWKKALEVAEDWNKSFINNGRQIGGKIDHVMLVENREVNKSSCHIYYANGTKRKIYNHIPYEAEAFIRDFAAPTDYREGKTNNITITMYGKKLGGSEK